MYIKLLIEEWWQSNEFTRYKVDTTSKLLGYLSSTMFSLRTIVASLNQSQIQQNK